MVSEEIKESKSSEIRLENLESDFYVSLSESGDQILKKILQTNSKNLDDSDKDRLNSYLLNRKDTVSATTLNSLPETDLFQSLKEEISHIKAGKRGNKLEIDGLPIEPLDSSWGFVFGMLPDTAINDCNIAIQSGELARRVKFCLEVIGLDIEIEESDRGYEIYGSRILARIIKKTGFTNLPRQVDENIKFPEWVYESAEIDFHRALIAGIIESEGCAPTLLSRSCRITQSKSMDLQDRDVNYSFETPTGNKVSMLANEHDSEDVDSPALLLSVKRLLGVYDIDATIKLDTVYRTERGSAGRFNLIITGEDIRKLYNFCSEYLVSKGSQFEAYFDEKQEKHLDNGTRFRSYLEGVKFLYRKNGYVTSEMLADYLDRETKTARNTLSLLDKKGLIECFGHKDQYKCWKPVEG